MMLALRKKITQAGPESGVTLVELMVAMIVFGILSAIVVSLFTAANKSVLSTSSSDQNTQAAGNAMDELSRVIRGGSTVTLTTGLTAAFVSATSNSLSVYSYVDSSALSTTPFLVQFSISGTNGQLIEKRFAVNVDSTGTVFTPDMSAPVQTRTFPGALTSTNASPLFAYTDQSDACLAGTAATPPVTGPPCTAGTVLAADLDNISAVTVTVVSQSSANATILPATLSNVVGVPNVTLEANN
jgi:prepilin-type N-terminal cleavage/methylation domain-containing protein